MIKEKLTYKSKDGITDISAYKYIPESEIKLIIQVAHGMREHLDRYDDFFNYLTSKGYLVVGNNHLGHKGSVVDEEHLGYFGNGGVDVLVEDMHTLTSMIKNEYPDLPYFFLGHSFGSFLTRNYLFKYSNELNGVILSGTGHEPVIKMKFAKAVCSLMEMVKGKHYRSKLIYDVCFGPYNTRTDKRTDMDWLCFDEEVVDRFLEDKYCTFNFTVNGFYTLFDAIERLHNKEKLSLIEKRLPVLFIAGEEDAVGNYTKGVDEAKKSLLDAGLIDVENIYYDDMRHEVLNETDKYRVYEDIDSWIDTRMRKR